MAQTTTVTLLTGDYPDRLNQLWAAAQAAKDADPELLAGEEHPYDVLAAEYADLKAEAEAEAERQRRKVTLQGVGRKQGLPGRPSWRDLKEKHPPRTEGDPDALKQDRLAGVNVETVECDLLYASIVTPEFGSRDAFDEWEGGLSEGEFQTVVRRAWDLANVAQTDPKSLPALPTRNGGASGR